MIQTDDPLPPLPRNRAATQWRFEVPTPVVVLLACLAVGGAGVVYLAHIVLQQGVRKSMRLQCHENLSQLGGIYVAERSSHPEARPRSGPGLFLEWRKAERLVRRGQEAAFLCPEDDEATRPETWDERAAYDTVDLDRPPRALCSYAVRDFAKFPLDPRSATPQPIAACIHHKGGANVMYDDGSCTFLELGDLGLSSDTQKQVGPASASPELQPLTYGASK